MRSRDTAYVFHDFAYLRKTWAPETRPEHIALNPTRGWLGLRIKRVEGGQSKDDDGIVEFVARSKTGSRAERHVECSRFRRIDDTWVYVSGDIPIS